MKPSFVGVGARGAWTDVGILGKTGRCYGKGAGTVMSEYSDCYCLNGV